MTRRSRVGPAQRTSSNAESPTLAETCRSLPQKVTSDSIFRHSGENSKGSLGSTTLFLASNRRTRFASLCSTCICLVTSR